MGTMATREMESHCTTPLRKTAGMRIASACPLQPSVSLDGTTFLDPIPFFSVSLVTVYSFAGGRIEDEDPILAATIEVKHTRDRSSDRVE
jgi:hypothetical protein